MSDMNMPDDDGDLGDVESGEERLRQQVGLETDEERPEGPDVPSTPAPPD